MPEPQGRLDLLKVETRKTLETGKSCRLEYQVMVKLQPSLVAYQVVESLLMVPFEKPGLILGRIFNSRSK
jgi:hypothetical protein